MSIRDITLISFEKKSVWLLIPPLLKSFWESFLDLKSIWESSSSWHITNIFRQTDFSEFFHVSFRRLNSSWILIGFHGQIIGNDDQTNIPNQNCAKWPKKTWNVQEILTKNNSGITQINSIYHLLEDWNENHKSRNEPVCFFFCYLFTCHFMPLTSIKFMQKNHMCSVESDLLSWVSRRKWSADVVALILCWFP